MESIEVVQLPLHTFHRMSNALIQVEKYLQVKGAEWVDEDVALKMLGCSQRTLYRLKKGEIKYKAIGRRHQYDKKSIEKYNEKMSSR